MGSDPSRQRYSPRSVWTCFNDTPCMLGTNPQQIQKCHAHIRTVQEELLQVRQQLAAATNPRAALSGTNGVTRGAFVWIVPIWVCQNLNLDVLCRACALPGQGAPLHSGASVQPTTIIPKHPIIAMVVFGVAALAATVPLVEGAAHAMAVVAGTHKRKALAPLGGLRRKVHNNYIKLEVMIKLSTKPWPT